MKIAGKTPSINHDIVVIPRGDEKFVFKLRAISGYDAFNEAVKTPEPPVKIMKGGNEGKDFDNPGYLKKLWDHHLLQYDWMCIETLKTTEDLEWETVKYDDPETWSNWRQEMLDSNFSQAEIDYLEKKISEVNNLTPEMMDKAKEDFLSGEPQQEDK